MPAISFEGAVGTGHGCFPPRNNLEGDDTFLINGVAAHAEGMDWGTHTCGDQTHGGAMGVGSATFLINGQTAARIGDPIACDDGSEAAVAEGDPTFLVSD